MARYGGEEFVAVLAYQDKEKALESAKNIADVVDELNIKHESSQVAEHVTVSVGVATATPGGDMEFSTLLEAADKAMFQAKSEGKRRIASKEL